ncbi:hypothetical protein [Mycoplasma testudineum]|uniref:hypothetical protein n=1 Tax=Mycoplasma testudineum TaxID=244584 RepID=UPI000B93BFD2|nr:hypothetical protein [Mycoplasma testudineum]OYD26767.1 hypothetical protein CG473_02315 [Mycoplasma testudineum]
MDNKIYKLVNFIDIDNHGFSAKLVNDNQYFFIKVLRNLTVTNDGRISINFSEKYFLNSELLSRSNLHPEYLFKMNTNNFLVGITKNIDGYSYSDLCYLYNWKITSKNLHDSLILLSKLFDFTNELFSSGFYFDDLNVKDLILDKNTLNFKLTNVEKIHKYNPSTHSKVLNEIQNNMRQTAANLYNYYVSLISDNYHKYNNLEILWLRTMTMAFDLDESNFDKYTNLLETILNKNKFSLDLRKLKNKILKEKYLMLQNENIPLEIMELLKNEFHKSIYKDLLNLVFIESNNFNINHFVKIVHDLKTNYGIANLWLENFYILIKNNAPEFIPKIVNIFLSGITKNIGDNYFIYDANTSLNDLTLKSGNSLFVLLLVAFNKIIKSDIFESWIKKLATPLSDFTNSNISLTTGKAGYLIALVASNYVKKIQPYSKLYKHIVFSLLNERVILDSHNGYLDNSFDIGIAGLIYSVKMFNDIKK